MKIFLAQPMNGKTDERIRKERENAVTCLKRLFHGEDIEILDTLFDCDAHPLVYLGKGIEIMADADIVCFMDGWDMARGCIIEHEVALRYGKKIKYLDIRGWLNESK